MSLSTNTYKFSSSIWLLLKSIDKDYNSVFIYELHIVMLLSILIAYEFTAL